VPTYEYKCERCGKVFEKFQKMSDEPVKKCPGCKGKVYRLIGAGSGIIFKGSGFYHTDYKNPSTRASGSTKSQGTDKEPCPKPKSEGCKNCSLNKDKEKDG